MPNPEDKIKIIKPSKEIFQIIESYTKLIQSALPHAKITLIGSFAVPMCGKEEFDLLIETNDVKIAQELIEEKGEGKFRIGPIVEDEGYCRSKKKFGIICELHILPKGHKKVKKYLALIDKLKNNPKVLKKYEELKISLDGSTEEIYKKEKINFLKENGLI